MKQSAWFKVPGSRFTVEGKTDSRLRTVNPEPKTLIRYVVYDFRSIVNPDEMLPRIEPCQVIACRLRISWRTHRKKGPAPWGTGPLNDHSNDARCGLRCVEWFGTPCQPGNLAITQGSIVDSYFVDGAGEVAVCMGGAASNGYVGIGRDIPDIL